MIKKIEILGLRLDNHTVREAMVQVDNYLSNDILNTIETVSMRTLLLAEEDEIVRDVVSSMDMTVISEKEIIQAAGAVTMQRVQETKENDFAIELFKRLERSKKSLFLLGETQERISNVREALLEQFPKLIVTGMYALEHCTGDFEAVINEMNVTAPDVIVSVLPTPQQEHFLADHKEKISASIWYGAGELEIPGKGRRGIRGLIKSRLHLERLKNSMNKYKNHEG